MDPCPQEMIRYVLRSHCGTPDAVTCSAVPVLTYFQLILCAFLPWLTIAEVCGHGASCECGYTVLSDSLLSSVLMHAA